MCNLNSQSCSCCYGHISFRHAGVMGCFHLVEWNSFRLKVLSNPYFRGSIFMKNRRGLITCMLTWLQVVLPHFWIFRNTQVPATASEYHSLTVAYLQGLFSWVSAGYAWAKLRLEWGGGNYIFLVLVCLWNSRSYIFHLPQCLYWLTLFIRSQCPVKGLRFLPKWKLKLWYTFSCFSVWSSIGSAILQF